MADQPLEIFRRQLDQAVASEKVRTDEWLVGVTQAVEAYVASLLHNAKLRDEASVRRHIQKSVEQYRDFIASIPANLQELARRTLLKTAEETLRKTVAHIQNATFKIR